MIYPFSHQRPDGVRNQRQKTRNHAHGLWLLVTGFSFILSSVLILPSPAQAQSPSVYARIKAISDAEFLIGASALQPRTADPAVQAFISSVYRPDEGALQPADIPLALSGDSSFCEPQPPPLTPDASGRYLWPAEFDSVPLPGVTTRKRLGKLNFRCQAVRSEIQKLAAREMRVRSLAQDLQLIAAGYEQPVMESPDLSLRLLTRTRGLLSIWKAGDSVRNGTLLSQAVEESDELEDLFTTLAEKLQELTSTVVGREKLIAAVNRYSLGGYRFAKGELANFPAPPAPGPGDAVGTERQYVLRQWNDVEDALQAIWEYLAAGPFDSPPGPGDILTFEIPTDYQRILPDNIRFRAYIENEEIAGTPRDGDAGLEWVLPEPTLPSVCRDGAGCQAIKGGRFPPALPTGTALCTHPLARLGFLCRPFTAPDDTACREAIAAQPGIITLAACTDPAPARETLHGPDSCEDIPWRSNGAPDDPVCTEDATSTEYRNSIGNNLCFFNRCMEAQDDAMPRDTGIVVQAGTSPVISCVRPDPQFGSLQIAAPFRPWAPPPYRPALIVRQLETALCAGMAPSGLSGMCGFPLVQGLHQVQGGILGSSTAVVNRGGERTQAIFELQDRTDALGARIATRLYLDYLTQRADTLASVIRTATALLSHFPRARFPQQMCPFNDAGGTNLLQTTECTP